MTALWYDLKFAARTWARAPAIAVTAIATIACGTAAITAVFALVSAVLLEPLPYPGGDRIVVLVNSLSGNTVRLPYVSPTRVRAWREQGAGIQDLAVYTLGQSVNLAVSGEGRQVAGAQVTASFFSFFGAPAARGRFFTADEDQPGRPPVAVLSEALWRGQFGGVDDVIGRTISVNGELATVVGVLDETFDARSLGPGAMRRPEIFLPLRLDPGTVDDSNHLVAATRLPPDVSIDMARQQARAAAERFRAEFPTELQSDTTFDVMPLASVVVGDVRPSLLMLLAAVGLIAVLVSVNTGNLLLARASARRREFVVRAAVGASRWRLVRQLLAEGVALAAVGGVVGGLLGLAAVRALVQFELVRVPRVDPLGIGGTVDLRLLSFVAMGALLMGLAVGLAPAAAARTHQDVERQLRTGSRGGQGRRERRAQGLLLVAEIAVACVVLIGAALLMRSLVSLRQVDPGFTATSVSTLQTASGDRRLASAADAVRVFQAGLQRLTDVPGIESAAVSLTGVPLAQTGALRVDVVGRPMAELYIPNWDLVSPGYFAVFRIPLLQGRLFSEWDRRGTTPVAVLNETMARQLWPDTDPLGQRVLVGQGAGPAFDEAVPREIIGIVGDVRQFGLSRAPRPGIYVPLAQMGDAQMALFNRLGVPATWAVRALPGAVVPSASLERQVLAATEMPAAQVRTMDDVFDASTASTAQNTWLMSTLGALAMLVAVLGVYSIASHAVQQRTHELGVRLALGEQPSAMRRSIVWEHTRLVLSGAMVGLVAAVGLSGLLTTLLFGVSRLDPLTFAAVPAVLVATALAGAYLPARRAATLDPLAVLRD